MSRIISDEELETFTILIDSEIDRLNEIIEIETEEERILSDEEVQDMIDERDKLVSMLVKLR